MIKAVVWDLGGVLVRTDDYTGREALARQHGMSREELEDLVYGEESGHRAQLGLLDVQQHWENVRKILGLTAEQIDTFRNQFWGGDRLDRELVETIRSLKNNYQTGLLSNAFSNLRQVIKETLQIADAFDEIVISAEEGLIKPNPRIYRVMLDRLGVAPEEAVFIDDMYENVEAARLLNMRAIQFQNSQQARSELGRILNEDHR